MPKDLHKWMIFFIVSKNGKKTPGLGYFWSGCAQAMKRGLEILGIALVDADTREAYAIRAVRHSSNVSIKDADTKGFLLYGLLFVGKGCD